MLTRTDNDYSEIEPLGAAAANASNVCLVRQCPKRGRRHTPKRSLLEAKSKSTLAAALTAAATPAASKPLPGGAAWQRSDWVVATACVLCGLVLCALLLVGRGPLARVVREQCSCARLVLALLVVQTSSIVLLMRYSKTRPVVDGPPYVTTSAVFAAELLKLLVCVCMAALTLGGVGELRTALAEELLGSGRLDTLKCAVPAVLYTLQSNLLFVALANLEAPTYQVSYQCKTLFTALLSWLMLDRRLKPSQWFALLMLFSGAVLVSDPWKSTGTKGPPTVTAAAHGSSHGEPTTTHNSPLVGLGAVLGAAILSSFSSVYFEMMLKKASSSAAAAAASLWLRNIQLGLFATPLAAGAMLANDGAFVAANGVLQGFDGVVWMIVLLNGVGGLLVAAAMKYADNIAKCFAAALAIVTGTLLSVPIFGFRLTPIFGVGATCTIVATTVYSLAPDITALASCSRTRDENKGYGSGV